MFSPRKIYTQNIGSLSTANAHAEYYLTDMAEVLRKARRRVVAWKTANPGEVLGGNTRAELAEIDEQMRLAKCRQLMADGVTIFYPTTCVIDADVEIAPDTVIEPYVQLLGKTKIGTACRVRSYCVIRDSEIGDGVTVRPGCIMDETRISAGAVIGPYSHLRTGSEIGEGAHVGNFVETKKIKLGKGSKANHLTYLGDAEIGAGVNIGAGTITCNYDGVHKHKTVIEDACFHRQRQHARSAGAGRQRRLCRGGVVHYRGCPSGLARSWPRAAGGERRMGEREAEKEIAGMSA